MFAVINIARLPSNDSFFVSKSKQKPGLVKFRKALTCDKFTNTVYNSNEDGKYKLTVNIVDIGSFRQSTLYQILVISDGSV